MICKMALDISLAVSILTLIALTASVILIVFQLRQLERSIKGSTYQSIIEAADRTQSVFLTYPELADIWEPLDYITTKGDVKQIRRDWLLVTIMEHYENMYFQYKQGNIPQQMWGGWELHLKRLFQSDTAFRRSWPAGKEFYSGEFRDFVDKIIAASSSGKA
jgi:hypothetical protein